MLVLSRRLRFEIAATSRLAGPLVGAQIAQIGLSFIDTVMAGRLSAGALAAVALGSSTWAPIHVFLLGVLLAVPPSVAQLDGAGRRGEAAPFARQAIWTGLGVAAPAILVTANLRPLLELMRVQPEIVPTVEGYLRALCWGIPALAAYLALRFLAEGLGDTRPILFIGLAGLPVNVFGNWVLMYGELGMPALGAVGCGYATALVWWAECLGMALYLALHPRFRGLRLFSRLEAPRPRAVAEILRLGTPIGVAIFTELSMFSVVALVLGSLGTEVVAAHQVALNFAAFTFMVPLGIAMAITVRVGNAVGRGDPAAARFSAFAGSGLAMLSQVLAAAVMLLFPRWVVGLYTADPAVTAIAVELLFLAALFQLSDGLQASAAGALRGLKDTGAIMLITLVAYWGVGLPLGYGLAFPAGLGARGMWMGLIGGLTVAAALLSGRFLRLSRRLVDRRAAGAGPQPDAPPRGRPPWTSGGSSPGGGRGRP